ncbi:site-specific integrase [uncultured Bacteroides sp.]|uniref:site-specific integrase n=1 Tax=uncultured Bacteroides sp. TaxID=162156 RepID=UPI002AA60A00|nr:site-specific integrase [uncultured Bacteroides sp.]
MDKIIYNLVFNRRRSLNERGMALVQVEAYLNKRRKYFSTKIYLTPMQWDNKRQLIKDHPNAEALNRMLYEHIALLEKEELSLWQQGKTITLDALKEALLPHKEDLSFLSFLRDEIINSSLNESTKRNHLSTYRLLNQYKKNILFSDLTFEFISSFEFHLRSKGYHINTIAKHMKHLKRYINVAINKDYMNIQKYAFRKYKIKTIENAHTHLSPDELEALEKLKLTGNNTKLQSTLDAFLFCCYAGLRYSDFINLTLDNFILLNKETWLIYKSVKTKTEVRLPLYLLFDGKSIPILERHMSNISDFFKLRDNSNINKDLIKISKLSGISKHISFHTARHTNATLLIYSGVNITTVQKLLGHKSIRTTQVYTNIMDMTIIRDLEKCTEGIYEKGIYSGKISRS